MDMTITKAPEGGTVHLIPSKSAVHRLLIAGELSGLDTSEMGGGISRDIDATKACLKSLREHLSRKGGSLPLFPCGESGSTLRFMLPVAAALGTGGSFLCEGRLPERPMGPLVEALERGGCTVTGENPRILNGKLRGGEFVLPGDVSSQYVTGLLLALPLAEEDSRIRIRGRLESRPYVDMTLDVLRRSGITVREEAPNPDSEEETSGESSGEERGSCFLIPGGQRYALDRKELEDFEGDWSGAAFWIVMDAMAEMTGGTEDAGDGEMTGAGKARLSGGEESRPGRLRCTGLREDSIQGDRAIAALARKIVCAGKEEVSVDVSHVPDLVPALAVLACARPEGAVSRITGAARLRIKESDRLRAVSSVLSGLGAAITEEEAGLVIVSRGGLKGGCANSFGDHRIVMMAAAARCACRGDVIIRGAEAVEKSYPGFFTEYERLGGRYLPSRPEKGER